MVFGTSVRLTVVQQENFIAMFLAMEACSLFVVPKLGLGGVPAYHRQMAQQSYITL